MKSRRDFLKKSVVSASLLPFLSFPYEAFAERQNKENLSVHIFSKHLQFLDYKVMGQMTAEMGFSGVDLTVRPKGHVLPESVKTDLPKAIAAIKEGGSDCLMMTTAIESANNSLDVDVLTTASELGIQYYRMGWLKYPKKQSMPDALKTYQKQLKKLGKLNQKLGIIGCYQNHAGTKVGASYWEIHQILKKAEPNYLGAQYDIRHALAEGGKSWTNGFELLQNQIKTIVLKDFKWGKVNGKWTIVNVPIGEGMVDFDQYFKLLKKHNLNPPVSLHLEYDLGGAQKGNRTLSVDEKVVYDAMKKDLKAVQTLWANA